MDSETFTRIQTAMRKLAEAVIEVYKTVKRALAEHCKEVAEVVFKDNQPTHPASKHKGFYKQQMHSQVVDRKPAFIRARTSC